MASPSLVSLLRDALAAVAASADDASSFDGASVALVRALDAGVVSLSAPPEVVPPSPESAGGVLAPLSLQELALLAAATDIVGALLLLPPLFLGGAGVADGAAEGLEAAIAARLARGATPRALGAAAASAAAAAAREGGDARGADVRGGAPLDAEGLARIARAAVAAARESGSAAGAAGAAGALAAQPRFLRATAALARFLAHPEADTRLIERAGPDAVAAVLALQRAAGSAPAPPAPRAAGEGCAAAAGSPDSPTAMKPAELLGAWPSALAASVLLTLLTGRLLPAPPASLRRGAGAAAAASGAPPPPPPADATPRWLRIAASADLARLAMREGGLEGILDAILSSVDGSSPVALDRARLVTAAVLAMPPLELADARS
jgi:hypothetical protein